MPKFRKTDVSIVDADQLTEDFYVDGKLWGRKGDWRIREGNGNRFCMTDKEFKEAYVRVWWSDTQQRYVAFS